MRIALGIEYDGRDFSGWQAQIGLRTVQSCLEEALSKIADEPIKLFCAGRTDAGVHATGQVVHFDTNAIRSEKAWILGTNTHLPSSIAVNWALPISDEFHARFSAISRRYRYIIYNNKVRPAILSSRVTWQYRPLQVELMQEAANYFLGEHDFSSFRSTRCEAKSPIRHISLLKITRENDFIFIDIQANAFLHHMVRNIAGLLMKIGSGHEKPSWAAEVLKAKDRRAAADTAAAAGLYLVQVGYPEPYLFPQSRAFFASL
ncbi:MAG: tRNA pseudouridine(38-40) synthase TruA [Gammaproteobacteria bacterium]|nr:tRNA pseudouridine(38-40) synthase TruA [Gammaproteobacteria bacterium]